MKKMLCMLFAVLLGALMILPAAALTGSPSSDVEFHSITLIDNANLLSENEKVLIADAIRQAKAHHNDQYYFCILTENYRVESKSALSSLVDLNVLKDAVILTIAYVNGEYSYYLFTLGETYDLISNAEVDAILDDPDVFFNLKSGNICEGTLAFIDITDDKLSADDMPMAQTTNFALIFIVSAIVALICCGVVVARYKMKLKPTNYPLDRFAKLNLTERQDNFVGSYITKTHVNNNSSGRSGGGRSGGGRGGR